LRASTFSQVAQHMQCGMDWRPADMTKSRPCSHSQEACCGSASYKGCCLRALCRAPSSARFMPWIFGPIPKFIHMYVCTCTFPNVSPQSLAASVCYCQGAIVKEYIYLPCQFLDMIFMRPSSAFPFFSGRLTCKLFASRRASNHL
jgi:hypothetical protein